MALSAFTTALLATTDPTDLAYLFGLSKYSSLSYLVYPIPSYTTFTIKKKNGSEREIHTPGKKLKQIQRQLLIALNELDNSRPSVHGFRKDRSIVTNAMVHSGIKKRYVFNIDLKDFFPSITFARVFGVFLAAPFGLPPNVAAVLARICTYNGTLPQGAPTSPAISNYICRSLDGTLQELAKSHFATYSRYADDLSFSFTKKKRELLPIEIVDLGPLLPVVGKKLSEAIEKNGFIVNTAKVRLRSRHTRMEVTGLTVNEFPNVRRKFVDEIRGMLHSWEKHGLKGAKNHFDLKQYKRQLRNEIKPPFANVLRGKLLYLRMVKGPLDKVYNALARRFNACVNSTPEPTAKTVPVCDLALSEAELERAVFVISCRNDSHHFEIKGTSFFLEKVGLVTCEHILRYPTNKDEQGNLIHDFSNGLIGQYFDDPHGKIFLQDTLETDLCELEIFWLNKQADVAVLRPKIQLSIDQLSLRGTSEFSSKEIILVGYPFHNPGKSLSLAEGKIRSRYRAWGLQHYDITPLIRQGNSGGPVLDSTFQVIGLAKEGERQDSGNNGVLRLEEIVALHHHFVNLHGAPLTGKFWT